MKILILAYHISPYRGSECSVAWNHIVHMSKYHAITVLYGSSGDHMGDDDDMQNFLASNTLPNVRFVKVETNLFIEFFNQLNRKGILTYSFYFAYKLWHKKVYEFCKSKIDINEYDLIHYLTPIGYREPGYLWKFDKPYIWGAIGGAPNVDFRLVSRLDLIGKLKFYTRAILNTIQLKFSRRLRKALIHTTVLLTATNENKKIFERVHSKKSIYIPENGTFGKFHESEFSMSNNNGKINLVWIGSVNHRKNLQLLVDAVCGVKDKFSIHINVIGSGHLLPYIKDLVKDKGLNDLFTFYGQLPRSSVAEIIKKSDLHVITSINEGNPTTIWEVMSYGLPTMTVSHCGMADTIKHDSGFHININDYDRMVYDMSNLLNKLINNPSDLHEMRNNVRRDFFIHHWDKRIEFFNNIYRKAVVDFDKSKVL